MSEPFWLETTAVANIGEAVVRETGEPFLIRDAGLLESAVMAGLVPAIHGASQVQAKR